MGLLFDCSRQRVSQDVIKSFGELADELQLRGRIDAMFRGDAINTSEDRAVLHTALRLSSLPDMQAGALGREAEATCDCKALTSDSLPAS